MKKTSKILFTLFVTLALLPGTLLTAYGFQFDPALPLLDETTQPCLMYSVGHVFAHKNITVGGIERPLVVVAIRGTAHLPGWPVLTAPVPKIKKTNKTQEKADNSPVSLN